MTRDSSGACCEARSGGADPPAVADPQRVFDAAHDVLGRKWHLRIVSQLLDDGPMGFSDLEGEIDGISAKMLSESLSALEAEGVVERTIVNQQPVRVEYSLSDRGAALADVVHGVLAWGVEHVEPADDR